MALSQSKIDFLKGEMKEIQAGLPDLLADLKEKNKVKTVALREASKAEGLVNRAKKRVAKIKEMLANDKAAKAAKKAGK